MRAKRSLLLAGHNIRLLFGDPGPIVIFVATPMLVMAILKDTQKVVLVNEGFKHANGAEQVVPGFTVMFAFFWVAFVARTFFVEHGWGTWERLQATAAGARDILAGKILPAFVAILFQMILLFIVGALAFGLTSSGPIWALLLVAVPLAFTVLTFTLAIIGLVSSLNQEEAVANLSMMVFASLGGAMTAISVLPGWAQTIAPATPSYWAMRASNDVILRGKGVSSVLLPAGVLLLFALGFCLVAAARFRMADRKAVA